MVRAHRAEDADQAAEDGSRAGGGGDRFFWANGLVIAPNQDFVLGSVPRREAGTAGAELITAQRIGAAIGIAIIGTVLFGSGSSSGGSGGSSHVMPQYLHTAQGAILADLGFILVALACAFALPRGLGEDRAEENA
jgi:hypothetical protein